MSSRPKQGALSNAPSPRQPLPATLKTAAEKGRGKSNRHPAPTGTHVSVPSASSPNRDPGAESPLARRRRGRGLGGTAARAGAALGPGGATGR